VTLGQTPGQGGGTRRPEHSHRDRDVGITWPYTRRQILTDDDDVGCMTTDTVSVVRRRQQTMAVNYVVTTLTSRQQRRRRHEIMAAFFKSFRKGFVVCRSLDANLSGKVAKKNDSDTEKRLPRPQCVSPLAIAAYLICHGVTEHG